ncbi:MAG: DUF1007 family protein [Hyphomicrobiales bacterium]
MRTLTPTLTALALAAATSLSTLPAAAHPHVWIVSHSDVVFDDQGRITAINIEWEFDEFYSMTAVEGLDVNGNGTYEPEELQPLAAENISALKDFSYFTKVRSGSGDEGLGAVTEFHSTFKDSRLTLYFQVPLAAPLDPRKSKVDLRMYDPSFYIAIEYAAKDPVNAVGTAPDGCAVELRKPDADADDAASQSEDYFANLLATQDLGSIYAETVVVDCQGKRAS